MALELGIDTRQIEAAKALGRRWARDPVQLRFVIAVLFLLVGWLGVNRPLAGRLARARERHEEIKASAEQADELVFLKTQRELYAERAAVPVDIVDWQNYVLAKLGHTSATLISLEPKETKGASVFKIIEMELVARGQRFDEFVDFLDRIEHGQRLMRVERVRLERMQTSISLTCTLKGLVKPGKATAEGDGGQAGRSASVAPDAEGAGAAGGASAEVDATAAAPSAEGGDPASEQAADGDAAAAEPRDAPAPPGEGAGAPRPGPDEEPVDAGAGGTARVPVRPPRDVAVVRATTCADAAGAARVVDFATLREGIEGQARSAGWTKNRVLARAAWPPPAGATDAVRRVDSRARAAVPSTGPRRG